MAAGAIEMLILAILQQHTRHLRWKKWKYRSGLCQYTQIAIDIRQMTKTVESSPWQYRFWLRLITVKKDFPLSNDGRIFSVTSSKLFFSLIRSLSRCFFQSFFHSFSYVAIYFAPKLPLIFSHYFLFQVTRAWIGHFEWLALPWRPCRATKGLGGR